MVRPSRSVKEKTMEKFLALCERLDIWVESWTPDWRPDWSKTLHAQLIWEFFIVAGFIAMMGILGYQFFGAGVDSRIRQNYADFPPQ
jgi:hypothetical protein